VCRSRATSNAVPVVVVGGSLNALAWYVACLMGAMPVYLLETTRAYARAAS
jgi:hypothetical protein